MCYRLQAALRPALLPLLFIAFLPALFSQADSESPDLSILDEKRSLYGLLSSSQRIQFTRAEELVKSGESELRRGEFMVNRGPSKLNPGEDLTEMKAQGERLIEKGRTKINQGQAAMVALLENAREQQASKAPPEDLPYDYTLEIVESYESALEDAASAVFRACWDASYNHIFFDRVFLSDAEATTKAAASLNNSTYETLIELDGTRFSLTLPTDFQLDLKPPEEGWQFSFENSDDFSGERIALLSIEVVEFADEAAVEERETERPEDDAPEAEVDDEGEVEAPAPPVQLLVIQALDLKNLRVLHQELRWIIPEAAAVSGSSVEDSLRLIEHEQKIQMLADLPEPYQFRIKTEGADRTRSIQLEAFLRAALIEHFPLEMVPLGTLKRAYPAAKNANFEELVNAHCRLQPEADEASRFDLSAVSDKTNRDLPLGTVELSADSF
ncbi:MAG: hypothetical protein ACLFU4_04810 [Opitutales bacterium]